MTDSISTTSPSQSENRWLVLFATACRIFVGIVFLAAGILKSFDPAGFAYQIETYDVISGPISVAAATFFIIIELILAAALILNFRPRIAVPSTAILILVFMIANIWAWSQGKTGGCGCFGQFADRTPGEVLIEDCVLLITLGIAWFGKRRIRYKDAVWKNRLFLATALIAFSSPFLGPRLPVDSFVTDLKVGANLADLSVADIDFDLSKGEYLITLLGQDCPNCEEIVGNMNQLAVSEAGPRVVGILVGEREAAVEFWWQHAPAFPLGYAPREEVGNLFRKLPRSFMMRDGVVVEVWEGAPKK